MLSHIQPFSGPEPAPADELERYEVDSALADTDSVTGTETTTLASSITRYREELGRTYHSYGARPFNSSTCTTQAQTKNNGRKENRYRN